MISYKIIVEDMKCRNCAKKITDALIEAGAEAVDVKLARKEVYVDSDLPVEVLYETIRQAGYEPTDLELI